MTSRWHKTKALFVCAIVVVFLYSCDAGVVYDKYVNTTMGATAVATYLNEHGYVKKKRQNNTLDMFSAHFIPSIADDIIPPA